MKRKLAILLLSIVTLASCHGETIVNPHIDKAYLSYTTRINSSRAGNSITPSFSITIEKTKSKSYSYLKLMVTYYYGQSFAFSKRTTYEWGRNDPNLMELNKNGKVTITTELPKMQRESMEPKKDEKTFTDPDGEVVEIVFWTLKL